MEHYELVYIIPNKYSDDEVKQITEKINQLIKDNGGVITLEKNMGKLKLAYPIKQTHYGTYIANEFDLEKKALKEVEGKIKLMNEVLRHLTLIKKIKGEAELAEEKRIKEKLMQKKTEEMKVELGKKEEPKEEKPAKKVSIEELDKKLEEILGSDII